MGWFDEQIRTRKQKDDDVFSDAFVNMASAVMGERVRAALRDENAQNLTAMGQLLQYYGVKQREVPSQIKDRNEQLEYLMRPAGIMRRYVNLNREWYKDAFGAMLAVRTDNETLTALIPSGFSGYRYQDSETGAWVKVNKGNQHLFYGEVLAFYKPFPLKKLTVADLLVYMAGTVSGADMAMFALAAAAVALVGLILPKLNYIIFSGVVVNGSMRLLAATAVFMVCVTVSRLMFSSVQQLLGQRINNKLSASVEAAAMMRVLSMPAAFFRRFGSGELSTITMYLNQLCVSLVSSVFSTGLTSIFSLSYLSQVFQYAPTLVVPSMLVLLATVAVMVVSSVVQMWESKEGLELSTKDAGMSFALISGVQKIRLAGAEKRAFARWANQYSKYAKWQYDPAFITVYTQVIALAVSLVGTLMLYAAAFQSGISVADYYAFNTAYGMVNGAFLSLVGLTMTIAQIKPILETVKPILENQPEISADKEVVTRLSGGIELNNVTFAYDENTPPIVDDMSFKIRPGQYVAIVGKTGCGKSTLMRLLLGFEQPQKGAIYYDGKDLSKIDQKSLRRRVGVVTQDGKLFNGDIFSNITVSAPWLTLDDAWEAAEMAGIADDIREMPMGMHTLISEGDGGISGGQRQRLMIARAVAPKPKLLMFDEATSALDNITQKKVSEALDKMKCTRIVIAHRLSTIRQCDRILVLDGGRIIEDGTYDQLIQQNGFFAELVARQRVDI